MIEKVTNPQKIVTDPVLLKELIKQGIDKDYVEFYQDYAPRVKGGGRSPYAKFYQDLKSGKRFMVASGLSMVKPDGSKIEAGWIPPVDTPAGKYHSKANLFSAIIDGKQVQLTCLSDQPTGAKEGDSSTWQPQLFLDGVEQSCGKVTLLEVDPVNENYSENTLEWDYGICKRRIRLIEGRLRERWVFVSNPNGEVRIKHNFSGNLPVKLGKYAINDDEELVSVDSFNNAEYPVEIGATSTYYPDADPETSSVDGRVQHLDANGLDWADIRVAAGNYGAGDEDYPFSRQIRSDSTLGKFDLCRRSIYVIDTSGLPDETTISAATFSLYGKSKIDDLACSPLLNIYASTPFANTDLQADDFVDVGSTPFCNTDKTQEAWNVGTPGTSNDFIFNNAGIAAISKTSVTKLGSREVTYDVGGAEPNYIASKSSGFEEWYADKGAGYKPKLVVTHIVLVALSGTLNLSGALGIKVITAKGGTLNSSGTLTNVYRQVKSLAGTLNTSGALGRKVGKALSGALSSSGTLNVKVKKALAGTLNSVGTLIGELWGHKFLSGSLGLSGSLIKKPKIGLAGTLTSAGTLGRKVSKSLAGTLTSSGALTKIYRQFKSLAGTLTSSGTLGRNVYKSLAGTLTSSGSLSSIYRQFKSLTGTLTSSGTLGRKISKALAGSLTSSGTLGKLSKVGLAGTLTSSGALGRKISKSLAGTLTSSGALGRKIFKDLAGALTSTGALSSILTKFKSLVGTLNMTGTLGRKTFKTLAGSLTSGGTLGRSIFKTLAGTLTSSGAINVKVKVSLAGTVSAVGTLGRNISKTLAGALSFVGTLISKYTSREEMSLRLTDSSGNMELLLTEEGGGR